MKHLGGGLLRCVLLRGSIVTRSSLEVLLEEASPVFVLGACSHGLSLMVTNLSLAFSNTMVWSHYGSQIFHMAWHSVDRYVLCTGNSSHTSHFIFCGTSSMWSLYPHSVTRFEDSLLLIVCRHRCSIDSFQLYAVPIDNSGWCSSRGFVIFWRDVVPEYCFRYGTPLSDGDLFYGSVTSLDNAITRGNVCTAESKSDSPLI